MRILFLWVATLALLGCQGSFASSDAARHKMEEESRKAVERGDYEEAFRLMLPLAEKGDPEAEFGLAILAGRGYGFSVENPSDDLKNRVMLRWMRKAALHGHDKAIQYLSDAYKNGWRSLGPNAAISKCFSESLLDKGKVSFCLEQEIR